MIMKNKLSVFLIFSFLVLKTSGQENILYLEIQQAKETIHFENAILNITDVDEKVLEKFINPNEVFFFGNISLDLKSKKTAAICLTIPAGKKNIVLELIEVPQSFYNYEVKISDGKVFPANKEIKHYRGIVKDEINSLAAFTFYQDEIIGLIYTDEGNFNLVKDSRLDRYILYNDKNLKEKLDFECGTVEGDSVSYLPEVLFRKRNELNEQITTRSGQSNVVSVINKNVRFYFETEYDIYQTLGSVSAVEVFISGLFNQVSTLYLNEDISTGISSLVMWTSSDPYTGTSTSSLLSQFQNIRTSFNGDLGMLLTFRNEVGGGMAAGFNGLCNASIDQRLAVSMLDNTNINFPTYSWSVYVVTHEFGHLFGSRHTHACVWNGNNTAIDGCAGYVEGNCPLPGYPTGGGTIMSYCHLNGRPGVNFNLGFGSQPGNIIRNSVINASCLTTCVSSYTNQTVTTNTTVTGCSGLTVQNVTVSNNANLTLTTPDSVIINGPFEVILGSTLNVQQ
jgi:hypothetical protein